MNLSAPQPLAARHRLEAFNCGKPALTDWLLRHARQAHASGSARTFIACDGDRVAGYFSLTVGQIDTLELPERVRRGMGQYPIPLIILARLAVDLDYQGGWVGFQPAAGCHSTDGYGGRASGHPGFTDASAL